MILDGVKFAVGLGIGIALMMAVIVIGCEMMFRFEQLAHRRGWRHTTDREMFPPRTTRASVILFENYHPLLRSHGK